MTRNGTAEIFDEAPVRSARMSAHRITPIERVEVITRGARRRWSPAEKRAIVAESLMPGAVGTEICRRHEISSGQLSTWRREFRTGVHDHPGVVVPVFARAVVMAADPGPGPIPASAPPARPQTPRRRSRRRTTSGAQIEIALPDGAIVRVGTAVDQIALARVLAVLRGQ